MEGLSGPATKPFELTTLQSNRRFDREPSRHFVLLTAMSVLLAGNLKSYYSETKGLSILTLWLDHFRADEPKHRIQIQKARGSKRSRAFYCVIETGQSVLVTEGGIA